MMEFVVMAFLRIQDQKIRWVRQNKKIRAETYKNVSINIAEGDIEGVNHGRKIILPATYCGSVRWYRLKNLESMAIVREKGKPHLFITMTCNPKHPLILKALPRGALPSNRPKIVLRVFDNNLFN